MTTQPPKKRPGLGSALAASLEGEKRRVEDRFAKADRLFGDEPPAAPTSPESEPAPPTAAEPPAAPARAKVIRDGFSFPPSEHARIEEMLIEAMKQGIRCNKSEVVRAALVAFAQLAPEERHALIRALEKPKPGRPV
jgi:hypothetical protein